RTSTFIALFLGCGILFVYAVGPKVYFYGHLLFTYPAPSWLHRIETVFRASGRMMWPLWYLLLVGCIYILARKWSIPWRRGIIVLALLIQLVDISRAFLNERDAIENRPHWSTATTSPLWHQFSARIKHVVFLQPKAMPAGFLAFAKNYKVVAAYAARNGMTINIAY